MKIRLIAAISFIFMMGLYSFAFPDSWYKFRGDLHNTGWSFARGPDSPDLKWSYEWRYYLHPGFPFDLNGSPVIGPDGTIYYPAEALYAFDREGEVIWTFDYNPGSDKDSLSCTPLVTKQNEIYFGTWDGYFYKLRVVDDYPVLQWRFFTEWGIEGSPSMSRDGQFIYFGAGDKYLYALRAKNGELLWKKNLNDIVMSAPCVAKNDNIYVGSCNGRIYCLSKFGSELWYLDTEDYVSAPGAINTLFLSENEENGFVRDLTTSSEKQYLYVGSWSNNFYCVDTETGEIIWSFYLSNTIRSGVGVGLSGSIFVTSYNYYLEGYSPIGYKKFYYGTQNVIFSSPAVDFDDNIYFGGKDGFFYSVDRNGELRWTFDSVDMNPGYNIGIEFYSGIVSSPAIGDDGTIYFASYEVVETNQFRMKFFALGPGSEAQNPRSAISIDAGEEKLRSFIGFANPGEEVKVDLYVAYHDPDGKLTFFPGSNEPFPFTITLPAEYRTPNIEFFRLNREELVDDGVYRFYAALTEPGTLDIVGTIESVSYVHDLE